MKIIAVRNAQIHPQFHPTVRLGYNPDTSEFSVSLYLPEPIVDEVPAAEHSLQLIGSASVNLSDLRRRYDWCDHQTYFLAVHAGNFLPLFALYPETLPNRETAVDYAQRLKRNLLVGINVPFGAATNDELFITVNLNADATDDNIEVDEHCTLTWSDAASSGAVRTMNFPFIQVQAPTSIPADGKATVQLRIEDVAGQLLDRDAVVYLEAVGGIVPFTRVRAQGGRATVPVSAAGMSVGDEIRVKFGWKYFPGAEEARIAVVAA
jgi:hypothetical protein